MPQKNIEKIENAYNIAQEKYASFEIDTEKICDVLRTIPISLHCWQGDDVSGFEKGDSSLSGGGIQATGNYHGKAKNVQELRSDLELALKLIPGTHRVNLHAMYGEFGGKIIDRNQISIDHFNGWLKWAQEKKLKLDFNATCFSHPKAESGFTLSNNDPTIRRFWIDHVKKCREIAAHFGRELKSPAIHNLWIPDGMKDIPINRIGYRNNLKASLDEIYTQKYDNNELKDAIEGKLFGIGSESFVVGSQEFYLGYAMQKNLMLCLDMGHFHPTECVADKISAIMQYSKELLIHVSRGVRWDSDHVVILNDDLRMIAEEIIRSQAISKIYLALDYFDASINRIGAWVIGARATLKSLLIALLEPYKILIESENSGNYFKRLAILEDIKTLPWGDVWNYYCVKNNVASDIEWIHEVEKYERDVLIKRI